MVYFNTECDLCGYEIESLINTVHHIEGLQILLISSESIDTILMFAERTIIPNSNLTTFLHDTDSLFPEMFDATNVPYTLLYNKEHKLIKRYKGQVKGETILKQIKEHERK